MIIIVGTLPRIAAVWRYSYIMCNTIHRNYSLFRIIIQMKVDFIHETTFLLLLLLLSNHLYVMLLISIKIIKVFID